MNHRQKIKIWIRDKKCLICGSKENLTVDHLIQRKDNGKSTSDNLKTLCRDCHIKKDRFKLYFYNFETGQYERKIYKSLNIKLSTGNSKKLLTKLFKDIY